VVEAYAPGQNFYEHDQNAIGSCEEGYGADREPIDGRSSLKRLYTDKPVFHLGCSDRPGHRHTRPDHHHANKDHAGLQRLWS
jgi:hypothetical protein